MGPSPLPETRTACFTGHRPSKLAFGYDETAAGCLSLKARLIEAVALLHAERGIGDFVSGMALGVDTWAAEAVLAARSAGMPVRLVAAVPLLGQEARWLPDAQVRFRRILGDADEVHVLHDGPYAPWMMLSRDRWMVDRSQIIVAAFDGSPGGTAHTVAYAMKRDVEMLRILPPGKPDGEASMRWEGQGLLF